MGIHKYRVINPVASTKMPFYNHQKGIFYIPLNKTYRYFVEAVVASNEGGFHYFILLSKVKFDINCRLCHTDNYGRVQVKIKGEIKDYVAKECIERGNVNAVYVETIDDYDVFSIE